MGGEGGDGRAGDGRGGDGRVDTLSMVRCCPCQVMVPTQCVL